MVGVDQRVEEVAAHLRRDGSVMLAGALGSGKSFFTAEVVRLLRERRLDPVIVRGANALSRAPLGALQAAADERLDPLLTGATDPEADPVLIVVDDAHALDSASLDVIARAIFTGSARVLLAVDADPSKGNAQAVVDLWLDGAAARFDLSPLDHATADALISAFVGPGSLDTATRAALFTRSVGSRRLLHELALDAAAASAAGRDPLDPARDLPPGSRLSDAFSVSLGECTEEECLALAVLGRLRGVEHATAAQNIDPEVLQSLIQRRAVFVDPSNERGLYTNAALAREAERRVAPEKLGAALDAVANRALASGPHPVGNAVDRLVASKWYIAKPTVPSPAEVDGRVRCRILANAARSANSRGRADLALAYVNLGRQTDGCATLHIEASRAYARLGRWQEAYQELTVHEPASMPADDLRRLVRWWGALLSWMPLGRGLEEIEEWLAAGGITDPTILCELDVQRAESACLEMDWARAVEHAKKVLAVPGSHTLARVRSGVMAGMADSELGRLDSGASTFAQAERANRDPVTGQTVSLLAELSILCFEAMTTILGGVATPGLAERLRAATLQAAQRDDRTGLAMVGIAAGTLHGIGTGDGARAEIEFAASLRRFERIEFALWRPLVVHSRIAALTQLGDLAGARALQEEVDPDLVASHRLYRVSGLIVEAQLRAAEGDPAGAAEAAAEALAEREAAGTTLPESIDVKRLTHLMGAGEMVPMQAYAPPGILKADLRSVGGHSTDRRTDRRGDRHTGDRHLADRHGAARAERGDAGRLVGAEPQTAERPRSEGQRFTQEIGSRRGADERGGRFDDRRGLGDAHREENGAEGAVLAELTDREHEIALLVSRQLTNKEIARQLFLSVRTVESHVYTARGKVGARTRRELGRMVAEADGGPTDSRGWRLA